jgi:predicted enzyme related to lactoylglutathione lyase
MTDSAARGRFVWHELLTPNGPAAQAFYARTLGWKTQGWEHDPSYSLFVGTSGPLGASIEKRTATPQWVAYIGTPDVAATVDAAVRLGGRLITPPTVVPNAGTHAVLADPQGATFAVHASSMPARPDAPAGHGEFSWHELATTTASTAAFAFYTALFGWDEISQLDMGPTGTYLIFGRNGQRLGGMFNKGHTGKPGPAYWLGYVRVRNLDEAIANAKAAGGAVLTGPMDVPGGDRIVQLTDPHGAFFAAHMLAADANATARTPARKRRAAKPAKNKPAKKRGKKTAAKKKVAKRPAPRRAAKKKRVAKKKRPTPRRSKRKTTRRR